MVYIGYNLIDVSMERDGVTNVTVGVIGRDGRRTHRATVPVLRPSMQHDVGRVGALTPGGCQIGYMCDQNSTYGSTPLSCCHQVFVIIRGASGCHSRGVSDLLHGTYWLSSVERVF
jgi:hypothetical protein